MKRSLTWMIAATLIVSATFEVRAQEMDDPVKIEMYKRFVDNRGPHQDIAYQTAREYLEKYPEDKNKYTEYMQKWVLAYQSERKRNLPILIEQKNFTEAFRLGAAILADEPDYLPALIALGYAGYLSSSNSSNKDETHNADALAYARKAIALLESGKDIDWAPFKGKDDTLAYLYYAKGFLTLKTNPDESIDAFIMSTNYDSEIRKTPSTYYFLAVAYESGPYKAREEVYRRTYAGKPDTPESKIVLQKLIAIMDRIIDAYARAIATASAKPSTEANRKEWLEQMMTYYKFRHEGSDAGLTEFIATSLQKPLPAKP